MLLQHEKDRGRILSEQLDVEADARIATSFWTERGGTSRVAAFANFKRRALELAFFFFPTMM